MGGGGSHHFVLTVKGRMFIAIIGNVQDDACRIAEQECRLRNDHQQCLAEATGSSLVQYQRQGGAYPRLALMESRKTRHAGP